MVCSGVGAREAAGPAGEVASNPFEVAGPGFSVLRTVPLVCIWVSGPEIGEVRLRISIIGAAYSNPKASKL